MRPLTVPYRTGRHRLRRSPAIADAENAVRHRGCGVTGRPQTPREVVSPRPRPANHHQGGQRLRRADVVGRVEPVGVGLLHIEVGMVHHGQHVFGGDGDDERAFMLACRSSHSAWPSLTPAVTSTSSAAKAWSGFWLDDLRDTSTASLKLPCVVKLPLWSRERGLA